MQDKLTSNQNHVEVLERFMRTMGFGNLSDVARYFSVKPQAVSLWKANAKIPFKRLIVMLDILDSREERMYESGYINVPAEKGVGIEDRRKLMGHALKTSTEGYTHADTNLARKYIDKL